MGDMDPAVTPGRAGDTGPRSRWRASPVRRRPIKLPFLLAALAVTACAAQAPSTPQPSQPGPTEVPAMPEPSESSPAGGTRITITIGATSYPATLADNPTARDLDAQLPLTLTFKDLNRVEKVAPLPRPLTTTGVPSGADPDINDIGYYSPSNDLVLYYGDVGYWDGIVRIGTLSKGVPTIARQPDGFTATITRA
jgi:hypothetical protein